MSRSIRYAFADGLARITLSADQTGNAIDAAMLDHLHAALSHATVEPSCRAVVLAAQGPDFCRGLDLEAAFQNGPPEPSMFRRFAECLILICRSERPVIAAVTGRVHGGGMGLVAACDLVLARNDVVFALPEVIVGMVPMIITPFLLRRLTPSRARYLALSSRSIFAPEAHLLGLVDDVVEDLDRALDQQLKRIFRSSPEALSEVKHYSTLLLPDALERHCETALDSCAAWIARPEVGAGVRAFLGGETPSWFAAARKQHDDLD